MVCLIFFCPETATIGWGYIVLWCLSPKKIRQQLTLVITIVSTVLQHKRVKYDHTKGGSANGLSHKTQMCGQLCRQKLVRTIYWGLARVAD